MDDICTYRVEVRGRIDTNDLNAASPLQMLTERTGTDATQLTVCTDQSGLIGLLRHLHGRGVMLLSVYREK